MPAFEMQMLIEIPELVFRPLLHPDYGPLPRAVLPAVSIDLVRAEAAQADSPHSGVSSNGRAPQATVGPSSRERRARDEGDITAAGAAIELGCSRTLIYRLIERGELPGTYELPGSKRKRIPWADILALKERHRVRTPIRTPIYKPVLSSTKRRESDSFADELEAVERGEAA
jgi:predicted DNA-binding transcriptional regulator AlpA